ncbi:MAG: hypothetical protein LBU22_10685 [Dysgonamonadaceae bacterium]|nr:hypothetical protein [Dysgonamonadaceae bacterium]
MATETVKKKPEKSATKAKTPSPEKKEERNRAEMFGYYRGKIFMAEGDVFNLGL